MPHQGKERPQTSNKRNQKMASTFQDGLNNEPKVIMQGNFMSREPVEKDSYQA